jgi:hypothetical protein
MYQLLASMQGQLNALQHYNEQHAQSVADAQLAARLHDTHISAPPSRAEGVKPLPGWIPSKQSFADFSINFSVHMVNFEVPTELWGLRLLTYIPEDAKLAFLRGANITALTPQSCTYEAVAAFCQEHQIAHIQTDMEIRRQLFFKFHQHNFYTKVTTPIGNHLSDLQALFNKCSCPLDASTQIFAAHNSLHPAIQSLMRYDPTTGKPFTSYERYRVVLVGLGDAIPAAIAEWERGNPRPGSKRSSGAPSRSDDIAGGSGASEPAAMDTGDAAGTDKRFKSGWTDAMKERARNGFCAYCNTKWFPSHRCRGKYGKQVTWLG